MVTREEIITAYKYLLGREPESEEAIKNHLQHNSVDEMKQIFIHSPEFASKYIKTLTVGRYIEQSVQNVQTECSESELNQMLEETKKTWSQFGEEAPHWSVLVSDEFLPNKIEENISIFYQKGFDNIELTLNILRRAGLKADGFEKALDYGCGVGRLSIPLSKYAKSLTSIDVSPGHLKLARERAKLTKSNNIDFVQLKQIQQLNDLSGYDFILSLIVLQHNPPPIMAYIYRRLLRALRPGGIAIIQMPTFMMDTFSVSEYLANPSGDMEMHALPQKAIFQIIDEEGCRPIEVAEDLWIGDIGLSHTFTVQKK